ncbi:MAG TPA: MBL fold metallo-hydrolase, partial [Gemmatimonadales bacterium]|nr:MBL fold metallo-hydrolase [Gemmatimonadales bacterium]
MIQIADRTTLIDLEYLGEPGHIATCLLETGEGLALVDPGPAITHDRLAEALRSFGATLQDVRILLITHIHLDHSGGAGRLAGELPRLRIYVHERGAPHLADPSRLLRSATMIYGDQMDRLWGPVVPIPADRIHPLAGGERLDLGGRVVEVAHTPGHAWHHNAYFDRATGIAFTGDVAGEQFPGSDRAIPVTPPPDIDVELILESGARILEWQPERLFPTHFGPVADPRAYLRDHEVRLVGWSHHVQASLQQPGTDEEHTARYVAAARAELEEALPAACHHFIRDDMLASNWVGLARYWRKKSERR